jgi:hypothetical protein
MGPFICLHPFIALGITATILEEGGDPWLWTVPSSVGNLTVPSPWLVYIALMIIVTVICLSLALQRIRPAEE